MIYISNAFNKLTSTILIFIVLKSIIYEHESLKTVTMTYFKLIIYYTNVDLFLFINTNLNLIVVLKFIFNGGCYFIMGVVLFSKLLVNYMRHLVILPWNILKISYLRISFLQCLHGIIVFWLRTLFYFSLSNELSNCLRNSYDLR